jgi:hypothetical protein
MQASGRSLFPLQCTSVESGLFGKTLIGLAAPAPRGCPEPPPLPAHRLTPHDVVALRTASGSKLEEGHSGSVTGVVYRVQDAKLTVAMDDLDDSLPLDVLLRLDKLADKVRCWQPGHRRW